MNISDSYLFDFVCASPYNSSSILTLGYYSHVVESMAVFIIDPFGKIITSGFVSSVNGFNRNEIRLPKIATAVYFVTLTNSSNSVTRKFFMQ